MRVYDRESEYSASGCVLALGMFDGVHIGHRQLLNMAVDISRETGVECVVATFFEHPGNVLNPEHAPVPLISFDEKMKRMEALGVDVVIAHRFTKDFAEILPEEYIRRLALQLNPSIIVVGYNYSFGKKGRGTPETLRSYEEKYHYRTVVVNPVTLGGAPVSSTAIRALLSEGKRGKANQMLGDI